jgi:hypothetical protein
MTSAVALLTRRKGTLCALPPVTPPVIEFFSGRVDSRGRFHANTPRLVPDTCEACDFWPRCEMVPCPNFGPEDMELEL